MAITDLAVLPECVQKVWNLNVDRPEIWASITASSGGGEGNWLKLGVQPAVAPNTGTYFAPEFKLNMGTVTAPGANDSLWRYEVEYIVEFRGSK